MLQPPTPQASTAVPLLQFCLVLQATYDKGSDSFVINTPDDTASKFWIGGAAQHGKVGAVSFLYQVQT